MGVDPSAASRSSPSEQLDSAARVGLSVGRHAEIVGREALHIVVGTILFVMLLVPAVGLHLLVDALSVRLKIAELLKYPIFCAEYSLVMADLVFFVCYLYQSTKANVLALRSPEGARKP